MLSSGHCYAKYAALHDTRGQILRHNRILAYIDAVARAGSIRKAAEHLSLTASALNRRIQDFEEDLGTPIFERLPRGVRLNAAGELVIRHVRSQRADLDKLQSQIADLSGARRGHVAIACSHAAAYTLLPREIGAYRAAFPAVTFSVMVLDHIRAQKALSDFSVDLVLVFEPGVQAELQVLYVLDEPLYAIAARDHLALQQPVVRLRDCMEYPVVLPDRSFGGRHLLELALQQRMIKLNTVIESNSFEMLRNYVLTENAITFQTLHGAPLDEHDRLIARPVDERDVAPGRLVLGQLRGRILPVAAAKFADQLARRLDNHRTDIGGT